MFFRAWRRSLLADVEKGFELARKMRVLPPLPLLRTMIPLSVLVKVLLKLIA